MQLRTKAWLGLAFLALVLGILLFASAGTVRYWQAWVYLAVFFGAAILITRDVIRRDPALLARRMKGGPGAEKRAAEKVIVFGASLGFAALFVVSALDHRSGWSSVPLYGVFAGDALVAIGFYFISRVYRANTFASATIEVVEDQKVISTGPYAIVRHPMYASALLYLLGTPLALGSYWGLVPLAATMPFLIWRVFDEEQLLSESLPGYREYRQKVRHRVIPRVW